MIFELRQYRSAPGRLKDLVTRYDDFTADCMRSHGIDVVGLWTPTVGDLNDLYVMLGHQSMAARERNWPGFVSDPQRVAHFTESEREGPLVANRRTQLLRGTPKSPLR